MPTDVAHARESEARETVLQNGLWFKDSEQPTPEATIANLRLGKALVLRSPTCGKTLCPGTVAADKWQSHDDVVVTRSARGRPRRALARRSQSFSGGSDG